NFMATYPHPNPPPPGEGTYWYFCNYLRHIGITPDVNASQINSQQRIAIIKCKGLLVADDPGTIFP
ncbi:hypothetical protein D4S03_04105, partial [bacterium]